MLSIIDRYISRLFLSYFASGLVVFVTLFVAIDFMTNFVRLDAPTSLLIPYYFAFTPAIIYQMVPVACLISTVFTMSTLNRNNELVALFSSGMSLVRISAPILAWVSVISLAVFFVGDRVLPPLAKKRNYLYYVEIKKRPGMYSTIKSSRIWYRSKNILFNIKTLHAGASRAQGITLYYFDDSWNLLQMMAAKEVVLDDRRWTLVDGSVTVFPKEQSSPITQAFKEKTITMDEDVKDLQSRAHPEDILSVSELRQYIKKNKEAGLDTLHYEVQYQSKFSFAFAAFVMSCIGIPFSVTRQRSGGVFANITLCLGLAFIYWAFYSSMLALGEHGYVLPVLSAWIPNISMLLISYGFVFRLKR